MSSLTSMWIHGTIVQAENQPYYLQIIRRGWGTHFVGAVGNWYHIPITTPVLLYDNRPTLQKLFVFYKATLAKITAVHIYDGNSRVKEFNGLNLTGDHTNGIDASNSWDINPKITIGYGLGISVHVETEDAMGMEVLFTTAGADFETM